MRLPLVIALVVAGNAFGADFTTTKGEVYHDATITGHDAEGISLTYDGGVVRIPFTEVSAEIQQRYRYDPVALAATRKASAEKEARRQADLAAAQQAEADRNAKWIEEKNAANRADAARVEQATRDERNAAVADAAVAGGMTIVGLVLTCAVLFLGLCFYFLPAWVGRHKENAKAIFVLNLVAGWTFAGWVIALVWACTKDSKLEAAFKQKLEDDKAAKSRKIEPKGPTIYLPK